ncbi:MAG: hypothetical protein AAGH65_00590, partial [Pseudomonadota bacterium]
AEINSTEPTGSFQPTVFRGTGLPPGLLLFSSRELFEQLVPAATCEDFEAGGFTGIDGFAAPLDSTTSNAFFAPGDIVEGITIADDPINDTGGGSASGLVGVAAGQFGTPSQSVVANTFADSLNITFDVPQALVALDVVNFTAEDAVDVSFFDATDTLIGTLNGPVGPAGAFLGVQSETPIARVNVFTVSGAGAEGGDNICFSNSSLLDSQPVPTLSAWSIIALSLLLMLAAFFGLRMRASA